MEHPQIIKRTTNGRFPTREYIRDCMLSRFYSVGELVSPLVSFCAEEAERIFLKYWQEKGDGNIIIERHIEKLIVADTHEVVIVKGGYNESARRLCPNCHEKRITQRYKYCPICGSAIKWK